MSCILEIRNLKKYYGKSLGIENVSLKINKGEIYGFIGPNGAGKSTTMRTIIGLINKTSGEVLFNGEKLDINDLETKEKIGYLPSEINLYKEMKVKEIFDYHASFYKKDLSKRRKELVKKLKIDEMKKISDLSIGNLKKVGIVLALMHEPELLILDEPTSGLDPIMQKVFHDLLKEEKEKGTAILYSSHILSEVAHLCDKVGFIKNGIIIKEDLMKNIREDNYTYVTIISKEKDEIKKDLNIKGDELKFINKMSPNELIKKLSKYDIEKLLIEEVSLEDLFENYYR